MKEGFKSIKEIMRDVAEEEGMTWTEIEDVWVHQKKYIKKKMEQDDVYAIFIPAIGTLSLNVRQYLKEIKHKNRNYYKDFIEKVKRLKSHDEYGMYGNSHKKNTSIHSLINYIFKNYDLDDNRKEIYSVHDKCWEIISKYSNGVLKKK